MQAPTTLYWAAVKCILRYLNGTLFHGLSLRRASSPSLHAYCDADWTGSIDDRKLTTGFCIFFVDNLISWSSKKQPTVARSSTEAEYKALSITSSDLTWLQYLLTELRSPLASPPVLWCDNIGATFLASNPVIHARTKHIEIDYHFVRERVASKSLQIRFLFPRSNCRHSHQTSSLSSLSSSLLQAHHVFTQSHLRGANRVITVTAQDQDQSTQLVRSGVS